MAKQSGLGANLYLAQYDLSGDVGMVNVLRGGRASLRITAIDKAAEERTLGLRSGEIGLTGFWNPTVSQITDVLNNMPTTDVIASATFPTTFGSYAVGDPAASLVGKQVDFNQQRGQDGSLGVTTQILSNGYPLEWGQLLTTGKQTIGTGTVNGTSVDGAAATTFGLAAYLHVFSIASGTMGVKLQDSADNSSFSDISGAAFTNVTAATSERIQTSLTGDVRRYVRLTTTGVHGDAVMAVVFVRYLLSQAT